MLLAEGFTEQELATIRPEMLTRQYLRSLATQFGGELEDGQTFNLGNGRGVVERDPYTRQYSEGYKPAFDPREGASPGYMWTDETRTRQTFIPGGQADPSQAGSLAASRRAPPRARSGGGGGGGRPPARPSGGARRVYQPNSIKWD